MRKLRPCLTGYNRSPVPEGLVRGRLRELIQRVFGGEKKTSLVDADVCSVSNSKDNSRNRRLLVADDDPLILALYKRLFVQGQSASRNRQEQYRKELESLTGLLDGEEEAGSDGCLRDSYELTSCSQGREVVAAVEDSVVAGTPFAVALIDMRMPPGINGLETARQIRKVDQNLQLIFVTAYSDHSTDQICEQVGGQVLFFHKPLQVEELYQTVRNCCWSWNQSDELRRLRESLEYRVEQQTDRLQERVRSADLLHQSAVHREQTIAELKDRNFILQAYRDLNQLLMQDPLPVPRSGELLQQQMDRLGDQPSLLLFTHSPTMGSEWQRRLERVGFEVRVAQTEERGVALALETSPDLVLIDSAFPGAGEALIQRLQERPETARVLPVVLLRREHESVSRAAGAVCWLEVEQEESVLLQRLGLIRDYMVDIKLQQVGVVDEVSARQQADSVAHNHRVLLVDDEQDNLDFLLSQLGALTDDLEVEEGVGELLETMGQKQPLSSSLDQAPQFEITTATQGREAVAAVLQAQQLGTPFAIALIDMRMPPGMDGLETARQIRQISSEIEIVITTAYSDYTLAQIRDVLGSNFSFMRKPFNGEEVYHRVVEGCSKWADTHTTRSTHQAFLGLAEAVQQEMELRRETERKLEYANRAREAFFSEMSHELRASLTTIIDFSQRLKEEDQIPQQYRDALEACVLAGKTLIQRVNDNLRLPGEE